MTVYVDDWRQEARVGRITARWSHLTADADDELHALARSIGLRRAWFQHDPDRPWKDHYDVTETKRQAAIRAGAVPIGWRENGKRMLAKRERMQAERLF